MSTYTDARDALDQSLNFAVPDSAEWIKINATIAALDQAERADRADDFVLASRRIDDAVAKLQAVLAGVRPDPASRLLERVDAALQMLLPLARNVDALLAGEPASALPGMEAVDRATFPTADEPIVPPLQQGARRSARDTASGIGVATMIDDILRREGGFVDHAADRGGPTNFGITMRTLSAVRGQPVSPADVKSMPRDEARAIYGRIYYTGPKIDKLPPAIQPLMFDMSINHGPGTAVRLLQRLLDDSGHACTVDGGIGDETCSGAESMVAQQGSRVVGMLVDRRVALYQQIVAQDASQRVFLRGWLNRADEFRPA